MTRHVQYQVTKGERRGSRLAAIFTVALCVTATVMLVLNSLLHTEVPTIPIKRQPILLPRGSSRVGVKASRRNSTTVGVPIAATTTTTTAETKPPTLAPTPPADGWFQNFPIYHKTENLHSTYSCVGENFRDDAWLFRSCRFRNLCFDMSNRTFVVFQSQDDHALAQLVVQDSNLTHIATVGTPTVSLGGINPKWRGDTRKALKWFPQILFEQPPDGYYELPTHTVWVPFHSFAGQNTGHLVWDDFFPIFKLLGMFDLLQYTLFLTKMDLKRWGTCDWNPKNIQKCIHTFQKFLPAMSMMDIPLSTVNSTNHDFNFVVRDERNNNNSNNKKSNYICAPHGAAGLGMLTDHGLKMHGWDEEDWESTYNAGRGQVFYEFRNFMLRNLGITTTTTRTSTTTPGLQVLGEPLPLPYNIVFSRYSSDTAGRVKGFGKQEKLLREALGNSHNLTITNHRMSKLSLHDQAEITSQAAIFVTAVGGGAMTATFLPRGASLILFYEAKGGRRGNRDTGKPARLDWDLLNHASHLRVHWLPIETSDESKDLQIFLELVKHELQIIKQL